MNTKGSEDDMVLSGRLMKGALAAHDHEHQSEGPPPRKKKRSVSSLAIGPNLIATLWEKGRHIFFTLAYARTQEQVDDLEKAIVTVIEENRLAQLTFYPGLACIILNPSKKTIVTTILVFFLLKGIAQYQPQLFQTVKILLDIALPYR